MKNKMEMLKNSITENILLAQAMDREMFVWGGSNKQTIAEYIQDSTAQRARDEIEQMRKNLSLSPVDVIVLVRQRAANPALQKLLDHSRL